MKLLSEELEKKFEQYPLYSQEGKFGDAIVLCKFFVPNSSATWLITEASKEDDDWIMFGFCNLGDMEMAELGYVSLNELQSMRLPYGLGVERSYLYDKLNINLRDACKREFNYIPEILRKKMSIEILQIKQGEEYHLKRFASLDNIVGTVDPNDYKTIFSNKEDSINMDDTNEVNQLLEELFKKYNIGEKPKDYLGHSLSVSDVIVISNSEKSKAYYCDSFGFKVLPEEFVNDWNKLKNDEAEKENLNNDIEDDFEDLDV